MAPADTRFKSQLLFIPFLEILNYLATHTKERGLITKKCTIIYTWPVTSEEQELQERVLRMAEDLKSVGITAFLDLTHVTPKISFESATVTWIRQCHTVLLVGSPSYAKRAADPSTITHNESRALSAKQSTRSGSVLPLLLAGNFGNSFPPGYNSTLGANISSLELYYQNFPEIVAILLHVHTNNLVAAKLRKYRKYTENILWRAETVAETQKAKLHQQSELQHKSWAARVLVLRSHFTPVQLNILDGKIAECERQISEYCKRVATEWDQLEVPEDITQGAPISLEGRLLSFLHHDKAKVLLLQAPAGAHKTQASLFVAYRAWMDLNWIPVVVDLCELQTIDEHCVTRTLKSHQLDDASISHAQAAKNFLIVIEGFDKRNCQVNFYVRNSLKNWTGKVVFTCRSTYIGKSAQGPFYFMPADSYQRPRPQELKIISFATAHSTPAAFDEELASNSATEVHEALLMEAAVNKPNLARERWQKAVADILGKKSFIFHYSKDQRARMNKGFAILQQDIVRPTFERFMAQLAHLKVSLSGDYTEEAFISYAWPVSKSDCTALQTRLLSVVQDMALAGIEVLLDVLRLSVGVDINEFMKAGIEKSQSIFWIGTPRLVERISFNTDNTPANPATIEFCHICEKIKEAPNSLYPLLFLGDSLEKSFPPLLGSSTPTQAVLDFRKDRDYFKILPQLAASVLGIDKHHEYQRMLIEFSANVREVEASFTATSILKRLETAEKEMQHDAAKMEERLKRLLSKIPESLLRQLEGTKEAQARAFHSLVVQNRTTALTKAAVDAGLALYIPLKGGAQLDTPPELFFEVKERVTEFLAEEDNKRVMLIQGGPGAGKTTFNRFLERYLWQQYYTDSFIPVFISLPNATNPYSDLVREAFVNLRFDDIDHEHLKMERFVFILDGLDELPLETMPSEGILITNEILKFPKAKILITCRNTYLTALEHKFSVTAHQHLAQQLSMVEDVFMMPFDNSQINRYLAEHCRSLEAEWNDWRTFREHIEKIPGLTVLAQNPFMLKLLTSTLPRLLTTHGAKRKIEAVDVYMTFTELWFEREMWKQLIQHSGIHPSEDRVRRYRAIAQHISQTLFAAGASSINTGELHLEQHDRQLLTGIPIQQHNGTMAFIHKSVQEFFTACAWISSLRSTSSLAQQLFGRRLASSEAGLLKFLAQMYNYEDHHEPLVNLVLASRETDDTQESRSTAAANAITVLNSVRFSFSGIDLAGVNIKGAILDNAMLHRTNLSNANLTNVSMKEVWAEGANISRAILLHTWFGRDADIVLSGECCGVAIRHGVLLALTTSGAIHSHVSRMPAYISVTTVLWTCFTIYDDVLFAGTSEGTICAWNISNKCLTVRPARVHEGKVQCITVFKGNVITGGADKTVCVWNIKSRITVRRLRGHSLKVLCVLAIPGRIISGGADGAIRVWSLTKGEVITSLFAGESVWCLAYFGKIICGTGDRIQVWDATTYKQIGEALQGHEAVVTSVVCFDGKIISGSADGTVRVWDISTGKQMGDLMAIHNPVVSLAVWDRKVYVGCKSDKVQVWEVAPKPLLQVDESLQGFTDSVNAVAVVGDTIAIAGGDATIQVLDAVTPRQLISPLVGHALTVKCVVIYDSYLLSTGGGQLIKWDISTSELKFRVSTGHVEFLEVFDGRVIAAGWTGMRVYDVESGRAYTVTKKPVLIMGVDAELGYAALYTRGKLELFDISTRRWLGALNVNSGVKCVQCAKGYIIIGIGFSPDIQIWDYQHKIHIATLHGHTQNVTKLATHGRKFASSDAHSVRVWDLVSFECLCVVEVVEDITAMAVGARWLAVATVSGELRKHPKRGVRWWKISDEPGQEAYLAGMNPGRWPLNLRDCNSTGVRGLADEQRALLHQLGANNLTVEWTIPLR